MKHQEKGKSAKHIVRRNLEVSDKHGYPYFEKAGIPVELLRKIPEARLDKKEMNRSVPQLTAFTTPDWIKRKEDGFSDYLKNLLNESRYFSDVRTGGTTDTVTPSKSSIVATFKRNSSKETILIQCRNESSFSPGAVAHLTKEVPARQESADLDRLVLAFPGRISKKSKTMLNAAGIELWDMDFIATNFTHEIRSVKNPVFQPLFKSYYTVFPGSQAEKYIRSLESCAYGKEHLPAYKKLIGQILKYLFHPPLELPIIEPYEHIRTNGSYLVIPNYASDGFWKFLRETYRADYIIVDVKNHKGKVKKRDALLLANHLKFHGAGLFGVIVARNDQDANCLLTLKEQWVADSKLIVVLSDEHIEEMILAKSSGGSAEDILGQVIENFRISL